MTLVISRIFAIAGVLMMVAGSMAAFFERRFSKKLHKISASDTSGALLVLIGILISGFQLAKVLFAIMFLVLWNPLITHTIAKTFLSRLRK